MSKQPDGSTAKQALLLSPEVPFPVIGGGALRTASIFEYLAERYTLDVITFRQPGAPDPRTAFPAGKVRDVHVIDLPAHSRKPAHRALRNLRRAIRGTPPLIDRFSGFEKQIAAAVGLRDYDLTIVEHFWCAAYVHQLRPRSTRVLIDLHNVESAWHSTLAASEQSATSSLYRRFAQACEDLERRFLPQFDILLTTSDADSERVAPCAPSVPRIVYPNALPILHRPVKIERNVIIFTGNLEYQPNIAAILHFRDRIWPAVKQRCPDIIWEIVGKNPEAIRKMISSDPQIRLVGPVDDAVGHIAGAKVAIVPLRAGSGTRIKILEAWAAATPVISTSIGAEGLAGRNGEHLMIADSDPEFASAIARMLADAGMRSRFGDAGRALYEVGYTWNGAWAILDRLL